MNLEIRYEFIQESIMNYETNYEFLKIIHLIHCGDLTAGHLVVQARILAANASNYYPGVQLKVHSTLPKPRSTMYWIWAIFISIACEARPREADHIPAGNYSSR